MKQITDMSELKSIELNIMKNIHEFCQTNNLTYYLAYGTLIGAIRHKGFIPWDDDIDIQMPREDYNRLIATFNKSNISNGRYKLVSPYDDMARHPFVKIIDTKTAKIEKGVKYESDYLGVDVDVFPIDGMPDAVEVYDSWYEKLKSIYAKFYYCIVDANVGSFKGRVYRHLMKMLYHDKNKYLREAEKIHSKYNYNDCEYVGTMESIFNGKGNRTRKSNFDGCIDWQFEDSLFKVPVGYDSILRDIYGNYMELPPKEKQVTHHTNNVYWLD